jgi:hypothetical protein
VGLLVVAVTATALFALLRDDDRLEARLTYAHLTYPGQFSERISTANALLKYERLHGLVREIGNGALADPQVDNWWSWPRRRTRSVAKPSRRLVDHRTGLLIELFNHRQRPLQAVQIRLPAKGLVQIRDAAGNDLAGGPTNRRNPQYRSGRAGHGYFDTGLRGDPPGRHQHPACRRQRRYPGVPAKCSASRRWWHTALS